MVGIAGDCCLLFGFGMHSDMMSCNHFQSLCAGAPCLCGYGRECSQPTCRSSARDGVQNKPFILQRVIAIVGVSVTPLRSGRVD